jgi:formylglycine-generating enzyme required for sulfatase activity
MNTYIPTRRLCATIMAGFGMMTFSAEASPSLTIEMPDGFPTLRIIGAEGALCQVQYIDSLTDTNGWICLSNFMAATDPYWVTDPGSTGATQRFYRTKAVRPNMALVSGGSFAMGDSFADLGADELPIHTATVSGFYMDRTEVSKALWDIVYSWATNHGYAFSANASLAKAITHPVYDLNWYDAVKWCNARSQFEGLTPCYFTNEDHSGVYCTGQIAISNSFVNWAANGYRLPTEAEWERGARGGANGMRFPWADTNVISHSRANYYAGAGYAYDLSTGGFHPAFSNAPGPCTSPCGYFAPNGFGLFDMAGNVWEWCWDWHDPYWYTNALASASDTRGPDSVSPARRVRRGGSFASNAPDSCCALREGALQTSTAGFRCVRRATASDLVIIPAGVFQMGDSFGEGSTNELPLHNVYVSAFYMGRTEVTKELWDTVYNWATNHDYGFDDPGASQGSDHPVQNVNWFDAVKWCNARSEMEGLTPAYYLDTSFSNVYRGPGQFLMWTNFVKWNADGYRLPTEAEWEKSARGGLSSLRFPWDNTITHTQANYYSTTDYLYDVSATRAYHPSYKSAGFPYTNPTQDFAPNAYGLYGMSGNVGEWCWDWFDAGWYGKAAATIDNCRGPRGDGMTYRVIRGGSWNVFANKLRCSYREISGVAFATGFRCARGL